jgi:hypothetical protein
VDGGRCRRRGVRIGEYTRTNKEEVGSVWLMRIVFFF